MSHQITSQALEWMHDLTEWRECGGCGRQFRADPDEGEVTCEDHPP